MPETRIEVVFSGDSTGSMSPVFGQVLRRIEDALTKLFKEIPNLRIGIGANGDYCDKGKTYITKWHDLSTDIHSLCQFVRNVGRTDGGDLPECYERVLHEARTLDWSYNAKKIFVLIADDVPHPVDESQNRIYNGGIGLDWRKEADELVKMGVAVYAVQCLNKGRHATVFYRELAERTGGYHLELDQFSEVVDLIMAVCYKQAGPEPFRGWERELERVGRMTRSMDLNFSRLFGRMTSSRFVNTPRDLNAVPFGRFQILDVDRDVKIRDFVEENGLTFRPGRGFYEFTKPEMVQEDKEVVLREKATGDIFSGDKAREMIGLLPGERARVKPRYFERFDVFIQSKSYTRKLIGGTRFLYEVDMYR